MLQQKLKRKTTGKKNYDKIGRDFCLVFNRVTMYQMDHPYTIQSISQFCQTLDESLTISSPIVIIMSHEQFFVEDEPFDSRLNTSRMVAHFKNCGIESISFETGTEEAELDSFFRIFCNPKKYPNADGMKSAIEASSVSHVKINYVFFKKMNSDEELILREDLQDIKNSESKNSRNSVYKEVLNKITENALVDEFENSISLKNLLDDPEDISRILIEKDLSISQGSNSQNENHGSVIEQQLAGLREEAGKLEQRRKDTNLSDLANAVYEMKAKLIAGIEEQKALGIIYSNEDKIRDEVDEISDRVVIQLVKEEYKKGAISIQRLGHILRRLIPNPEEIRRLLPKLKEAMLAEGMPPGDFIELVKEIGKELETDELLEVLKTSAEKIGLDSEELIQRLKIDPDSAAELIFLASEIRNGNEDEKVLTDLLVDYIEKMGHKFVGELDGHDPESESNILRDVLLNLGSKLVDKLKVKNLDEDVLLAAEKRLTDRIDNFLDRIDLDQVSNANTSAPEPTAEKTSVIEMLEESVEEGDELQKILMRVRDGIDASRIDENNFKQIYDEIFRIKNERKKSKSGKNLPVGVLNHPNTLLYLEKEISRSLRYDTPFSTITFSVTELKPQKPVAAGLIGGKDISQSIMEELIDHLRGADIVGILNKKLIVILLPMTNGADARVALQRIRKRLNTNPVVINDVPILIQFAGAITTCDHELTPDLQTYISAAENNHNDLVVRIKNVKDLM